MVILDAKATEAVQKARLSPEDVRRVLSRLLAIVPHIAFSNWSLFDDIDEDIDKNLPWAHYAQSGGAHCHLFIENIHIAADIAAHFGEIRDADLELLDHMAREAASLLHTAIETSISLSDFGMHSVSKSIAETIGLPPGRVSNYLKFLRSLAGETYENQRLSYGLILLKTSHHDNSGVLEFDNKRFKRLTDGFSTALSLDRNGNIIKLVALTATRESKNSTLGRPWWFAALADTATYNNGLGIALTKGGDILVAHQRELLFSQRAGEWRVWRHSQLLGAIQNSWRPKGRKSKLHKVLRILYRVALDLSFRRSGALLVIAESRAKAPKLVNATSDMVGDNARTKAEKALDNSLSGSSILNIDRRIIADLASLDGALVVDRTGVILAYGAMVRSKKNTDAQGARTRAAIGASMLGLAIKVSSDGGISVHRKGDEVLLF